MATVQPADRPNLTTVVDTMEAWGGAPAVVNHLGVRRFVTSYGEVALLARRFAAELARRQIGPGERVLLWGRNSAAWVSAYFGCVLRGAVPVPLDAAGTPRFAARIAEEVRPRLVVADRLLLGRQHFKMPSMHLQELGAQLPRHPLHTPVVLTRDSPLQLLFTSGTTGTPKGIVHTHGNLLASIVPIEREIAKYRRFERLVHPLRILHTLPLSHVFGQFMGLWIPAILGATVHYEHRITGSRIAADIKRDRIHVLAAVPRTLDLLCAWFAANVPGLPEQAAAAQGLPVAKRWWRFRRLHRSLGVRFWAAVCGGATLNAATEQFWTTLGFALIQGYGLTESSALVTLNHPFRITRGSLGSPLPGRELRVAPSGELEVKGAMVSTATWEGGKVVKREDPWLATGDLASIGENGQVRFLGRSGQRLVTAAGLNVYLQDVEQALAAQHAIREAIVLPVASSAGGDEPGAVLVAADNGAAAAAVAAANTTLAPHQQVRRWWRWPDLALPLTGSGKVARQQVQDWVAAKIAEAPEAGQLQTGDPVVALLLSVGASQGPPEDHARLDEDWGMDSMGRVALTAALEERVGVTLGEGAAEGLKTLGDLREVLGGGGGGSGGKGTVRLIQSSKTSSQPSPASAAPRAAESPVQQASALRFSYPRWPLSPLFIAARALFIELVARPLTWLLAHPVVHRTGTLKGPVLLIANHRTVMDVPLLVYALPPGIRRRMAVAMSGEMLIGWQRSWRPGRLQNAMERHRQWWGPLAAFAVKALFNVFPLPDGAGFRAGFDYAGRALDRGFSVLIFPEGQRSPQGELLPFKAGVGMLAAEAYVPVVPAALRIDTGGGLHGRCRIAMGEALAIDPEADPQQTTLILRASVERLLQAESPLPS